MASSSGITDRKSPSEHEVVQMYFLERSELWKTIKPYSFQYVLEEDFPLHNLKLSHHATKIRDMRPMLSSLSLDVQGFEVHRLKTSMGYSDFGEYHKIHDIYVSELEAYFKEQLGAKHVRALDYQLRRRDKGFPETSHLRLGNPQPSLQTHVDVSLKGLEKIVQEVYGDLAERIMAARFCCITIWRPLEYPVQDWPLAVCDATSVNDEDFVETDVIWPEYVAENRVLHFNKDQRWYWLPDQCENEVLVFKAIDSDHKRAAACPHGAFELPKPVPGAKPRESIDVRLLLMYAEVDYPQVDMWKTV